MLKTLKIIIFTTLLVSFNLSAKDSFLIQQLHEKYHNISYYQAEYIQSKNVPYISKPLITTGKLEFALGLGLIWEVNKPMWTKTLINESGVFKSTKYHKKQKVKDRQIQVIAEIMTELLSANLDKVESKFNLTLINEGDEQGIWEVQLEPKGLLMKKALEKITLKGISNEQIKQSGITEIIIIDKSNNITTIALDEKKLLKNILTNDIRKSFE